MLTGHCIDRYNRRTDCEHPSSEGLHSNQRGFSAAALHGVADPRNLKKYQTDRSAAIVR